MRLLSINQGKSPLQFPSHAQTITKFDGACGDLQAGVHFTLCGGTVAKLGTAKHHEAVLPHLDDLSWPGCFGMTELGHGSNVMGIETQVSKGSILHFCCVRPPVSPCRGFEVQMGTQAPFLPMAALRSTGTGLSSSFTETY